MISSRSRTWQVCNKVRKDTGYRSGLEVSVAQNLKNADVEFDYEEINLLYTETRVYIPDFILPKQAIVIEAKGLFDSADRSKLINVKKAYPNLDIRLIFNNAGARLSKGSKTTYGGWCDKQGFPYCSKTIPDDWLRHIPNAASLQALSEVYY